jgi:predicted nucleotidyltransferase
MMPVFRAIPPDMSADAVQQVDAMLSEIQSTEGVHIPWAIESGSRAWGFPSPDSDYDARFIYVRPAAQAVTIWPRRDVIERPIVGDMDVNGWDLSKALRLILKGNAVVVEWLQSPIVYSGEIWLRDALLDFAETWTDRVRLEAHYRHLGLRQQSIYLDGEAEPALKKVFYALRPAAAVRWLRLHPDRLLPPMHFPTLLAEADPPAEVAQLTRDLIARKAVSCELGTGQTPEPLREFIRTTLGDDIGSERTQSPSDEAKAAADELFVLATLRLDAA